MTMAQSGADQQLAQQEEKTVSGMQRQPMENIKVDQI
jgi:hypothetical protein